MNKTILTTTSIYCLATIIKATINVDINNIITLNIIYNYIILPLNCYHSLNNNC